MTPIVNESNKEIIVKADEIILASVSFELCNEMAKDQVRILYNNFPDLPDEYRRNFGYFFSGLIQEGYRQGIADMLNKEVNHRIRGIGRISHSND